MKKLSFILIAALLLSACSGRYYKNGNDLYIQSHQGAPLVVPPPLTRANISSFYDLPQQNGSLRVNTAPPGEEIITS